MITCEEVFELTNLPLHDLDENRIWCAIVAQACEPTAWLQMLTLAGHQARRWEPKRHWGGLLVAMLARLRCPSPAADH